VRLGAAAETVALDRALKALADRDPGDLDLLAGLEGLDGDRVAGGELRLAANLDEAAVRTDAVRLEMTPLRSRELAVGHRIPRELDGVVAVRRPRAHADDRARTGLDDGDRRQRAGLLVEDLCHADLPAQDALHRDRLELDLDVDAGR
jgi:hypothetical protein